MSASVRCIVVAAGLLAALLPGCAGGGADAGGADGRRARRAVAADPAAARPDDPYAALQLEDVHGRRLDLAEYRGRVRVFDLWASWCGPCRKIIPELNDLYARLRNRGLVVIGLSLDDHPAAVAAFQRRIPLRYPNGMFNEEAAKLFGYPDAVPTTYLVDRDGVIRERFIGWVDHRTLEKAVLGLL